MTQTNSKTEELNSSKAMENANEQPMSYADTLRETM